MDESYDEYPLDGSDGDGGTSSRGTGLRFDDGARDDAEEMESDEGSDGPRGGRPSRDDLRTRSASDNGEP